MKKFFSSTRKIILFGSFLGICPFGYSLTEEEFYQILKKKRELLSSGKITMKVYHIIWKNESEYKKFADELKTFTYVSPEKFKEWFSKKEETLPKQPNQPSLWTYQTYYFEGIDKIPYRREHLIEEYPLEKIKKFFEEIKQKYKGIVIKFPVKKEYSWDGTVYKGYEIYLTKEYGGENILTVSPDEKKIQIYCPKLYDIDYSFSSLENLPKMYKNYEFIYDEPKVIFKSKDGKMVFDTSFSCGAIEIIVFYKDGKKAIEIFAGGYSLIDNIVHLPCFSSITRFYPDRIDQTLYVIENYELRPVKKEEFSIKLLPNTKIIDYTFGEEPKTYFYKEGEYEEKN